ncbi:hypothetical protein G7Y89_g14873 [Cudoniella acicularis]|uniref:Uncharacterized protein n=1 Tax=Cudoniella acicularis TaxID=354080 RepID=A0A8H4VQU4_9HELO|nr:hypothetical protein G7Y89_g14873 [Cudoniella acicularis]
MLADKCQALFATQMFHNLGVEWTGFLLSFLAVAFMPIPFLFHIYGERLRKMSSYAPTDIGRKGGNDEENANGMEDKDMRDEEKTDNDES